MMERRAPATPLGFPAAPPRPDALARMVSVVVPTVRKPALFQSDSLWSWGSFFSPPSCAKWFFGLHFTEPLWMLSSGSPPCFQRAGLRGQMGTREVFLELLLATSLKGH